LGALLELARYPEEQNHQLRPIGLDDMINKKCVLLLSSKEEGRRQCQELKNVIRETLTTLRTGSFGLYYSDSV
jgi:hypothetical protein